MKSLFFLFALLSFGSFSWSSIPKNNLSFPAYTKGLSTGISQDSFNTIAEKIERIYSPVVSRLGGKFSINKRWEFMSVNAFAYRFEDKWTVEISGGLARHPLMTEDAYALAVCHEIGHLLGGAPKDKKPVKKIYSNEGQADYFAVTKCLRFYFENEDNAKVISRAQVPELLKKSCLKTYRNKKDQDICIRSGLAGLDSGKFFASQQKATDPKFETSDSTIVPETSDPHPKAQCRVDTYFQGILCDKAAEQDFSDEDEAVGACHELNGDNLGLRPRCWFKPKVR